MYIRFSVRSDQIAVDGLQDAAVNINAATTAGCVQVDEASLQVVEVGIDRFVISCDDNVFKIKASAGKICELSRGVSGRARIQDKP